MALFKWDDSLRFNIEVIDQQHEQLIKAITKLEKAMLKGESRTVMKDIFNELTIFLTIHFQTEEKIFESITYPGAERHKEEHRGFIRKVNTFKDEFEDEKIGLAVEIMNFMCDWVLNHIKNVDREYADLITRQQLIK
ncbi:MAG: bacteriohemerythrin [Desulfobulbaceae bacterium]|nr:bacteriohemerythrin [Desulfobulbaceae bacterium]